MVKLHTDELAIPEVRVALRCRHIFAILHAFDWKILHYHNPHHIIDSWIRCGCKKRRHILQNCASCEPCVIPQVSTVIQYCWLWVWRNISRLRPNLLGILPENCDLYPFNVALWCFQWAGWWRRHKMAETFAHCLNPLASQCLPEYWVFVGGFDHFRQYFHYEMTVKFHQGISSWRIHYKPLTCSSHYRGIRLVDPRPQVAHLSGPVEASVVLLISELFLCLNIKIQHFAQLLAVTLTWVLLQVDTCCVCLCMHAFWLLKT